MNEKYKKLDALVIAALSATRPKEFTPLLAGAVRAECDELEKNDHAEAFRILDRRLQALRKAGKIRYTRGSKGGWVLVE